jgi:2-dehydropantoate 2-reductase
MVIAYARKGHIGHFDYGKITIGAHQKANRKILKQVCFDFREAGVQAEYSSNLRWSRWKKLVWNIPYNGLTVVLNTTTEILMQQPQSRQLIYDLMIEVIEAANCCGVDVPEDFAREMMDSTDKMSPYAPSMKLDFWAGRPMEITAIYTNPIRIALQAGCRMRKVAMLEQQLRFIESNLGLLVP